MPRLRAYVSTKETMHLHLKTSMAPTPAIRAFWFRERNFGDRLTEYLLHSYGYDYCYSEMSTADLVGVGSILHQVPSSFSGIILGSGFMYQEARRSFPAATFAAVRGRLTAERCGAPPDCLLGDAGLLVGRSGQSKGPPDRLVGIVPHYVDRDSPMLHALARRHPNDLRIIDVLSDPPTVIEAIAQSAYILSSSLHGLVAADALGIPNRWLVLSDAVLGSGFKFRDYYSAYAEVREPLEIDGSENLLHLIVETRAPPDMVPECIDRFDRLFRNLGDMCVQRRAGMV